MDFHQFMEIYDDVFSPVYFLMLCALIVVYYDSKKTGRLPQALAVTFGAYLIAYATYSVWYFIQPAPQWIEDSLAVSGLFLTIMVAMVALIKGIYDGVVLDGIYMLIALSIPYVIISPFWNISGHVAYTTAPVLYLIRLDKRWWPLMVIPLIMVVNRPIVNAHTIAESIGGFVLALTVFSGFCLCIWIRKRKN